MHSDGDRLEPGTRVGAYSIERFVRRGAKASVYRAVQPELDRAVAIHIAVSPSGTAAAASFVAEAQALAGYDHPHLVPVYETGSDDGFVFAASGLADAEPLADLLAAGTL